MAAATPMGTESDDHGKRDDDRVQQRAATSCCRSKGREPVRRRADPGVTEGKWLVLKVAAP